MSENLPDISWLIAFAAGALSFFSPCILPLLPAYLSYISGISLAELEAGHQDARVRVFVSSLLFVLGFAVIFTFLGASASFLGSLLVQHKRFLIKIAGLLIIVMGLFILGLIKVPFLFQERRFHISQLSLGPLTALFVGMAFALGWTPCIGPILSSILMYAGTTGIMERGALLLLIYSLGLGIPFILSGLILNNILGAFDWIKRNFRLINSISGGLLILWGILLFTGKIFYINTLFLRILEFRPPLW